MRGDFVESLSARMEDLSRSAAQLAEAIGASLPYVSKLLRGEENLTIRSMAKLARATKSVVRIHLAPDGTSTRSIDRADGMARTRKRSRRRVVRPERRRSSARALR